MSDGRSQPDPLAGARIAVTRPAERAGPMQERIRQAGGEPLAFPAIEIRAHSTRDVGRGPLGEAHSFDLMVFVSPTAARIGCRRLGEMGIDVGELVVAAVGNGTAEALEQAGAARVVVPEHGSDSEALLATGPLAAPAGKRILIVRGEGGRPLLADELARRGAEVAIAEIYRRDPPRWDFEALVEGKPHILVVTSSEALVHLESLAGPDRSRWLKGVPLMVIHPRIAEKARERGFEQVFTSAAPDDRAVVEALGSWWSACDKLEEQTKAPPRR